MRGKPACCQPSHSSVSGMQGRGACLRKYLLVSGAGWPYERQRLQLGSRAEALANSALQLAAVAPLPPVRKPPPQRRLAPPPPKSADVELLPGSKAIVVTYKPPTATTAPGALSFVAACRAPVSRREAVSRCRLHAVKTPGRRPNPARLPKHPCCCHAWSTADPALFRCMGTRVPAGRGADIVGTSSLAPGAQQVMSCRAAVCVLGARSR